MTLEQLAVVSAPQINIDNEKNHCLVEFTPTVPHCGMSTLIGVSCGRFQFTAPQIL